MNWIEFLLACSLSKENQRNKLNHVYNKDAIKNGASKKVQLIISCKEYPLNEIEKLGKIKYALPIIQSYAVEVDRDNLDKIMKMEGVIKVENDDCLTAQVDINDGYLIAQFSNNASKGKGYENNDNMILKNKEVKKHYGEGIGVAVLDTGIYPHKDFGNPTRIIAFQDFINHREYPYDDNGHGTHVAGIIGGNGDESNGKYKGVAPKVNLIGVKVLGKDGSGNISDVLAGIQWVFDNREKYNIQIINMSVGMADIEGETSVLVKGTNVAWDHGFYVICAAGNNGPRLSSITTPGVSRKVITVGSVDRQNETSSFSSRGPTKDCIIKPEVIAPGSKVISCATNPNYDGKEKLQDHKEVGYTVKTGTSMATPMISGVAASLQSDFKNIENKDFKLALKYTSKTADLHRNQEGWGMVDFDSLYAYFLKTPTDNINSN